MPTGRETRGGREEEEVLYGGESRGEGSANTVNFTSLDADLQYVCRASLLIGSPSNLKHI